MENINMKSTQLVADSYKSYHHSVYLYIYYKIGKDEEAKDLSQDVFLRLMDYKQILRPETVIPTCTNEVESQIIANNLLTCEWERANQLPEQRRKIYIMSRFENKSSADIAAQLGISSRTVENHLFISRKEIREYIQQCI